MSDSMLGDGRVNQKRRTRAAIIAAAARVLAEGTLPSVAEAADAAGVSRATAYRYFTTQEQLLHEVALDNASRDVDQVVDAIPAQGLPAERLDAVVEAVFRLVTANELAFRTLLRLSLEPEASREPPTADVLRRGGRRIRWIETALEPVRGQFTDAQFQQLVASLALCTGIETQIVLRDICNLDASEAERITRWVAQTLLAASLAEAR